MIVLAYVDDLSLLRPSPHTDVVYYGLMMGLEKHFTLGVASPIYSLSHNHNTMLWFQERMIGLGRHENVACHLSLSLSSNVF
jgi:hypothetical protein